MIFLMVLIAISPGDMTGFWHSDPDLNDGYESCYFFWESGEYVYLESIEEGIVDMGDWFLTTDELVLNRWEKKKLDGSSVNTQYREISMEISVPFGKTGRILLDGEYFYRLDRDPDSAMISLMPTYGMSQSESDAFSTYD